MTYSFQLQLFLAGKTAQSDHIARTLRSLCDELLDKNYSLEVIDVLQHPERAQQAAVLVAPTLLSQTALNSRRLIGDLTNRDSFARFLEVEQKAGTSEF